MSDGLDGPLQPGIRHVYVHDLEMMASVGIFEVEKRYQQRLIASVDLEVVDDYDGHSDRLEGVVDYGLIVTAVRDIVDSAHFQLLETLAHRIAEACLSDKRVVRATIRLEKPDIFPGCRAVGIRIVRINAMR